MRSVLPRDCVRMAQEPGAERLVRRSEETSRGSTELSDLATLKALAQPRVGSTCFSTSPCTAPPPRRRWPGHSGSTPEPPAITCVSSPVRLRGGSRPTGRGGRPRQGALVAGRPGDRRCRRAVGRAPRCGSSSTAEPPRVRRRPRTLRADAGAGAEAVTDAEADGEVGEAESLGQRLPLLARQHPADAPRTPRVLRGVHRAPQPLQAPRGRHPARRPHRAHPVPRLPGPRRRARRRAREPSGTPRRPGSRPS